MKHALVVVGLGPTEIMLILLVILIPLTVLALLIIGIVRLFVLRRPREDQPWPLPGSASPFQLHQAIGVRLQSVGVTPRGLQVDPTTREVTVELSKPASPRLGADIRKTLAPLDVEVVWYEGSFEQVSRSPEEENPS